MSDTTNTNPELPDYAQPQKGSEADESTETADDVDELEVGDYNPLTEESR